MHATFQDFTNEESGGISDEMVEAFETDNESFINREVIDVNLDDTENIFKGTRLYIDHNYKLFSSKDLPTKKTLAILKLDIFFNTKRKVIKLHKALVILIFLELLTSLVILVKALKIY